MSLNLVAGKFRKPSSARSVIVPPLPVGRIFAALGYLVVEEGADELFHLLEPPPEWFEELWPAAADQSLLLIERFPFLENFLIDAREFWHRKTAGLIRSGFWTEEDMGGKEWVLEATAACVDERRLLLIRWLGPSFEEWRSVLQEARERALECQRLALAADALRASEAKAWTLLESMPDTMFRLKRDGSYLDFSGSKPGWATASKKLHDVLPPDLADLFAERVDQALAQGGVHSLEYRRDLGGQPHDLEARVAPCGPDEVLVIVRDITARKQAEAELFTTLEQVKTSRDDLLLILDQLRIGAALTDERGRCVFLNQPACRIFGRNQDQVNGKHWTQLEFLSRYDVARLKEMERKPPKQRSRVAIQWERADGRRYWMDVDLQNDPRNPQRKLLLLYDVSETQDLRRLLDDRSQLQDMVGHSRAMQLLFRLIRHLSHVDTTVLIEGETGTGKELVARALHSLSPRRNGPFIALNCAGLPESLVASQLFGHTRGAFTGAIAEAPGLFEAARGGVLFLDEIGDIPPAVQINLLRVLQEKEVMRLGETKPRKIDVRVLAATHRDLNVEVAAGRFRADLLYRVRVARIRVPKLAERREDIPLLASRFLGELQAGTGKPLREISSSAMRRLMEHSWPGNVRELRSALEYAVLHCIGQVIRPNDLPPEIVEPSESIAPDRPTARLSGHAQLLEALEETRGNRAKAARLLGISRATLYRLLASLEHSEPRDEGRS